jgi:para-nitrobenzyl esterase
VGLFVFARGYIIGAMLKALTRAAATLAVLLAAASAYAAVAEPIRTENGLVTGTPGAYPDVRVFKGLPFAAPPVGDLRWRPPQPAKNWDGVRAASTFSANCMQRQAGGGAFPPYGGDRSATEMSEDCLYLNIYSTAASAGDRRPVMVWIHGGAFTSGAGAIYQGEELARKGAVVVTVNYRLGVFGFLAHPELTKESPNHSSGDYAVLDQIAALKWVQKNIAAFGGDPARVAIFGESAGSWSVNNLVATPLAKGLFQRAIGESGGQFSITRTLADAEQAGAKFGEANGAASLSALRAMPAAALNGANGFQTSATVDGWVFPQDVMTIFKNGKQNDVPVIIGSNADEGSIFTPATVTGASFKQQTERQYGADAATVLKLYPFTSDHEARAAQAAAMRDRTFGWEMRTWARLQTQTGKSKVYLYYLSHVPPLPNAEWIGAQHGAEIPYAFNWPNGTLSAAVPWTDADRKLAEQVSSYWVNFAATGDPNGGNLPKWTAYSAKDDQAMGFGDVPRMIPVPNKAALDFLDGAMPRLRDASSPQRSTGGR